MATTIRIEQFKNFDEEAEDAVGTSMSGVGGITVIYQDDSDIILISGSESSYNLSDAYIPYYSSSSGTLVDSILHLTGDGQSIQSNGAIGIGDLASDPIGSIAELLIAKTYDCAQLPWASPLQINDVISGTLGEEGGYTAISMYTATDEAIDVNSYPFWYSGLWSFFAPSCATEYVEGISAGINNHQAVVMKEANIFLGELYTIDPGGEVTTGSVYSARFSHAGTIGDGFLYKGYYEDAYYGPGTFTNKWGIHISGEDKNYLSGNLMIGGNLEVTGTISGSLSATYLTNGYIPYYSSTSGTLLNSPIWTNGTALVIGDISYVDDMLSIAYTPVNDTGAQTLNIFSYATATTSGTYNNYGLILTANPKVLAGVTNSGYVGAGVFSGLGTTGFSGTLSNLFGGYFYYGTQTNADDNCAVTDGRGVYIKAYYQKGTVGNLYDLYLDTPSTGGTLTGNYYGIYQASANALNYLNGKLGIGTIPSYPLHISKTFGDEGADDIWILDTLAGNLTTDRVYTGIGIAPTIEWIENGNNLYADGVYVNLAPAGDSYQVRAGIFGAVNYQAVTMDTGIGAAGYVYNLDTGGTLSLGKSLYAYLENNGTASTAHLMQGEYISGGSSIISDFKGSSIEVSSNAGTIESAMLFYGTTTATPGVIGSLYGAYLYLYSAATTDSAICGVHVEEQPGAGSATTTVSEEIGFRASLSTPDGQDSTIGELTGSKTQLAVYGNVGGAPITTLAHGYYTDLTTFANSVVDTYYAFYSNTNKQGTITNNWGFYVTGEDKNYLSGKLYVEEVEIGTGLTPTNYTKFDSTGHQTMVGTAKPWDDLRIEPVARTIGTNAPTFEKWYDNAGGTSRGVYLYSFDDAAEGSEKEVHFTMQMPHSWDGGDIYMHVHWVGAVATTSGTPRWGMEYIWKDVSEVFGDTDIIYSDGNNYTVSGTDTNIVAHKHYISKFAALTPGTTADGMSSILIGRLFRNSSNAADTYSESGAKCGLLYIDAHFQLNSLGSTDEYSK